MKIALLTATFQSFSGIDQVVRLQARELSAQGHEVLILCLKKGMQCPEAEVLSLGMPKNILLQRIYRLFFFLDKKKIQKATSIIQCCSLVYAHQYPMTLIAQKARKKYKSHYIYYNHGIAPPVVFDSVIERIYMFLFTKIAKHSIKHADNAISISHYLAKQLLFETGISSQVRYNTIDISRFHLNISGAKVREKYSLGARPVILYVGRLSPHKGVHLLIQIFNQVLESIPNAVLLIVGSRVFSRYGMKLDALVKRNVIFTGFVSDQELPTYYAACDVYASASLWEGFDLPIAEAHACGKPAVVFNIGAHAELRDYGVVLVQVNNSQQFVDSLLHLLSNRV